MSDLLRSMQSLDRLVLLYLPRASSYAASKQRGTNLCTTWPINLRELHFNGGFVENNNIFVHSLPPSVSALWFEHCPRLHLRFVMPFFDAKGAQLDYLRISLPARSLNAEIMDCIARSCGFLLHLSINIEILDHHWQGLSSLGLGSTFPRVQCLEIDRLEEHDDDDLGAYLANLSDRLYNGDIEFPSLRRLLVHRKLKWTNSELRSKYVAEINDLLKALAQEDGEGAQICEDKAGVILFGQL